MKIFDNSDQNISKLYSIEIAFADLVLRKKCVAFKVKK